MSKLYISDHVFSYVEDLFDDQPGGKMAYTNNHMATIRVRSTMAESVKRTTIMHEVIHALCCINDLAIDNSETQVSVLANGVLMFLRDNPEMARRLLARSE